MLRTFKSSETEPWKERVVVIHRPARSSFEILTDGNPHKIPWMVPTRDWAPPSFPPHPSYDCNPYRPPLRGPGPASLNSGYGGERKRSINSGVPLGKGTGVFWRAGHARSRRCLKNIRCRLHPNWPCGKYSFLHQISES